MVDRPEHLRANLETLDAAERLILETISDEDDPKYGIPAAERQVLIDALHAARKKYFYKLERSLDHD